MGIMGLGRPGLGGVRRGDVSGVTEGGGGRGEHCPEVPVECSRVLEGKEVRRWEGEEEPAEGILAGRSGETRRACVGPTWVSRCPVYGSRGRAGSGVRGSRGFLCSLRKRWPEID